MNDVELGCNLWTNEKRPSNLDFQVRRERRETMKFVECPLIWCLVATESDTKQMMEEAYNNPLKLLIEHQFAIVEHNDVVDRAIG